MMVQDAHQAEDLTQDTFLKAYQSLAHFQYNSSPKTWLYRIAHNTTIDFLRKQKPIRLIKEMLKYKKAEQPEPDEVLQMKESTQELYRALGELKESYREVIILRKIKGFSIAETASILNWSESKVKSTLHRALSVLKKELMKEADIHEQIIREKFL